MRTMSRTCWKTVLEPAKAFAETCVAGIMFGHLSTGSLMWRWRRRACPVLPQDVAGRCEALGSATLVHVPNPAREELCAIFCDGLEEMLDGDDNWSKVARCTHRLLLGAVPKGVNPTSELRTRLRLWRTDCLEELLTRREQHRRGIVESRNAVTRRLPRLRRAVLGQTVWSLCGSESWSTAVRVC